MMEIRIHGRGGQGAVTAAELLAIAAFCDGKFSQAFPSFGVERRGAPVMAFCRIAETPIRLREQIYSPEYVIIQDASLVVFDPQVLIGIEKCYAVLINSEKTNWPEIKNKNIVNIPATKIAIEKIGKPFINTALIGAFAGMTGAVSLAGLTRAVTEKFGGKDNKVAESNVAAMEEAYRLVKKS
ncbi:pyruvate ferredoxin oxidoreductase subunit gamma [Candidatus Falkowbacteria bacterium]|nr:pyruvate ferredoxin oxidoreductase subunit gamma [Candidatus Falkowbacteria bacterium]